MDTYFRRIRQKRWIADREHAKSGVYLLTIDWVMMISDVK